MSLVIGENCYVGVDGANDLIHGSFMNNSNIRKFWDELNNEDKEIIIESSTNLYDTDRMLYSGKKVDGSQHLQYPRINWSGAVIEAPKKIILGYLVQYLTDRINEGSDFGGMQLDGVKSFADGSGAKIEFDSSSTISNNNKNSLGISKSIWDKYFKEFSIIV